MAMSGGFPAFKQVVFQTFRAASSKEKKKNDAYRVLRLHIMIEFLDVLSQTCRTDKAFQLNYIFLVEVIAFEF